MRELIALPGQRLFQFVNGDGKPSAFDQRRLNGYIKAHLGDEFSAKDFRTWGGTLIAAIELAQQEPPETPTEAKTPDRSRHAACRREARQYTGRCAVVLRQPRRGGAVSRRENHRRFQTAPFARGGRTGYHVGCRRAGHVAPAPVVENSRVACRSVIWGEIRFREACVVARKTILVCDNCGKEVDESRGASLRVTYVDARRGSKVADLCDDCAGQMPGRAAARRGRRPKSAAEPS
jgi:hypothetical protein